MAPVAEFKIGAKRFVILERAHYPRLLRAEADRRDARIAERVSRQIREGKVKTYTHEKVKRMLESKRARK